MQVGKEVTFPEEDSCGSCFRRVRKEVGAGSFAGLNGLTGSLQQCLLLIAVAQDEIVRNRAG